ncbi:MerR family transcriptional regulator [Flavimaricola marinus]|uniref:HTH-type transcriptional regulator ZntR n=1 Tax=Flavimaricola marinus TaxID=1819565 RepID=A0A238LG20_9RHOB|nr:helix-turn-helix domain-containing protein [Flavimaricola marinus]SMY08581.1 HTH-type transcriptional regulator ZntR [Flavimaricola marinus]
MSPQPGDFTIGEAARASGVKVTTVRFYESRGLLPAPPRSEGNRRLYAQSHVDRLRFIRHARELGFALEDVATLLSLSDEPDQSCAAVDAIARAQRAEVTRRIARLEALGVELDRMIATCAGGTVGECRVIESLSDHAHCAADHPGPAPM